MVEAQAGDGDPGLLAVLAHHVDIHVIDALFDGRGEDPPASVRTFTHGHRGVTQAQTTVKTRRRVGKVRLRFVNVCGTEVSASAVPRHTDRRVAIAQIDGNLRNSSGRITHRRVRIARDTGNPVCTTAKIVTCTWVRDASPGRRGRRDV